MTTMTSFTASGISEGMNELAKDTGDALHEIMGKYVEDGETIDSIDHSVSFIHNPFRDNFYNWLLTGIVKLK